MILTADDAVETVVDAMRLGAHDYLAKPIVPDRLIASLEEAIEKNRLAHEEVAEPLAEALPDLPGVVGESEAMLDVVRQVGRVARSDVSVLLLGETGTGKELVARALHRSGPRRDGPFVALNCAAVPASLQESELFGHERGAFTGADERRIGRFERADGGTLFLDEVAELSPELQAKLLRALQERAIERVGGTELIRSDFRVVAATHQDLWEAVAERRFRADLYHRLAVFEIEIPPLRDRTGDVPLLTAAILERLVEGAAPTLAADALRALQAYSWPGNVRELENVLQRAIVVADGGAILRRDLPRRILDPASATPPAGTRTLEEVENQTILEAYERSGGNVSEIARELGIARATLYRKLKKLDLR